MQQDSLTQALYRNYTRAGRETGYWGNYFLRELRKHGGLKVAQSILKKSTNGGETKGFLALRDAQRPDLSVEAVVLYPEFRNLFTVDELAIAEKRLEYISGHKTPAGTTFYPDELPLHRKYYEGTVTKIQVNRYERDPHARAACLAKNGTRCTVCGLRFDERYGDIGHGFIHVHHVKPIARIRKKYRIVPEVDLVVVCPNCHAMLHTSEPPLSVDELKARLKLS